MKKSNVVLTNRIPRGTPGRACRVPAASLLASLSLLVVSAGGARAQDPIVRAYADPPEVAVGDQFRLVVEISGAETIESVTLPERFDFARTMGRSGATAGAQVGNAEGRGSPSMFTLTYAYVARDPGLFEVGPFRIVADGRALETEPVAVLVNREGDSEVVIRARIEPSRVVVGDDVTLSVEVVGTLSGTPEFVAPDVFDFAWRVGPTGSVSDTNWNWSMTVSEEGEFIIPPVRVVDGNRTYESEALTLVVGARPISVETTLESGSIWVGGEFVFELEVMGVARLDEEPATPLPDAVAELIGVQEYSHDFMEKRVERTYRFRARRAGEFEIGPMRIVTDGQVFESQPVSMVVDEVPTGDSEPSDGLLLQGVPNKTFAYVNEPVVVEYAVAAEPEIMGLMIGTKSWPSFDDFDVLELAPGRFRREVVVDGRRYERRRVRRVALLPLRAGQLDLGVATVEARMFVRGFAAARGGPSFTSAIITSEPHTLDVLPLPDEGRPESFQGHVGTLEAVSWVDRTRAEVGETVTLQVEVSVEGLVEALPEPEIDFPGGFEVSEPETDSDLPWRGGGLRGTRTYTYHLTATTPGTFVIPAVEMSYFDPETESYGTTRTHPFTVTVLPAGAEAR